MYKKNILGTIIALMGSCGFDRVAAMERVLPDYKQAEINDWNSLPESKKDPVRHRNVSESLTLRIENLNKELEKKNKELNYLLEAHNSQPMKNIFNILKDDLEKQKEQYIEKKQDWSLLCDINYQLTLEKIKKINILPRFKDTYPEAAKKAKAEKKRLKKDIIALSKEIGQLTRALDQWVE